MMEQKFVPFKIHPNVFNDPNRFEDLAVHDCTCEDCGTAVGWHGSEFVEYWIVSEDMEELFCNDCWEQSACWEMDDCIECDRPRWINHYGKCEECEGK